MKDRNKIGILTTYFAANFGAMLQPFALKRYLESLGYDVEMIRYRQDNIEHHYNPYRLDFFKVYSVKGLLRAAFIWPFEVKKYHNFQRFMLERINPEKGFCEKIPSDKDFYFIGSDQIWNPQNTDGFDDVYFGNFKTKDGALKASYAASAGYIDYNEQNVQYLKENLNNFDYVSVRENSLEQDLKKYVGCKDICTVLDPTMLVDPKVYDEIKHINPSPEQDFVFFYDIRQCREFAGKALEHARSINARLVIVSAEVDPHYCRYAMANKDVIYIPTAGEEVFLGAMKYAKFVYTASFHGSVFAIINHRPFHTFNLHDKGMSRLQHLLGTLGLSDRLQSLDEPHSDKEINWNEVERRISDQRRLSRDFIDTVLGRGKSNTR